MTGLYGLGGGVVKTGPEDDTDDEPVEDSELEADVDPELEPDDEADEESELEAVEESDDEPDEVLDDVETVEIEVDTEVVVGCGTIGLSGTSGTRPSIASRGMHRAGSPGDGQPLSPQAACPTM